MLYSTQLNYHGNSWKIRGNEAVAMITNLVTSGKSFNFNLVLINIAKKINVNN